MLERVMLLPLTFSEKMAGNSTFCCVFTETELASNTVMIALRCAGALAALTNPGIRHMISEPATAAAADVERVSCSGPDGAVNEGVTTTLATLRLEHLASAAEVLSK